jgi:hypothetical protein
MLPNHLRRSCFLPLLLLACVLTGVHAEEPHPTSHETCRVEGWTVQVDPRLYSDEHAELGERAVALLGARLADVVTVVPADKVARLRKVTIWLDLDHGKLGSMQYHPSADWLEQNGYSRKLARGVHIPVAAQFVSPKHQHIQPWCVLHELAHAYHDQVLDFEHKGIKDCYEHFVATGRGREVLHVDGRTTTHYAMTNHKEFFAEMTECYFGTNDFYPFVHGELKEAEPATYALLREIWGPTSLEE